MKEFKSWQSYWNFAESVTRTYRYCWDDNVQQFLDAVLETSTDRIFKIDQGKFVWRAQLGNAWREECSEDGEVMVETPIPHPPERMTPLMNEAQEGRANPKGIPYLYVSNNQETASSEVRPWLGAYVTTAELRIERDLTIVDCSKLHDRTFIHINEPESKDREKAVWSHIDRAFSRPVSDNDRVAMYTPTQIISDLFKSKGYDGLAYKSALSDGYNLVFFDTNSASIGNRFLTEVDKIEFKFKPA